MAQAEDETRETLVRIFLDDIPVDINASELGVYLDLDRLVTGPAGVDVEDRAYVISLDTGETVFRAPRFFFGATGWQEVSAPDSFEGALGECHEADGELRRVRVCDAEISLWISRPLALGPPGAPPAVGIALSDDRFSAVFPPELTALSSLGNPTLDRRNFVTLFLHPPTGPSLKFISWNVRRFGPLERRLLGDDPFSVVREGNQAQLIWQADVIALQEVWSGRG